MTAVQSLSFGCNFHGGCDPHPCWTGKKPAPPTHRCIHHKCARPFSMAADFCSSPSAAATATATATAATDARLANLEALRIAVREKFTQEASPPPPCSSRSRDSISLARALLLIAAEDETFMAFNREMDSRSFDVERRDPATTNSSVNEVDQSEWDSVEAILLAGKTISVWMKELDVISEQVIAELGGISSSKDQVLEAISRVLFRTRGFKTSPPESSDHKCHYLHSVLSGSVGSATMIGTIFVEISKRLGIEAIGSRTGDDFPVWPQTWGPPELFRNSDDLNSCESLLGRLEIVTNRDIIGIALAKLVRLHWSRASRMKLGLRLSWPLRPPTTDNAGKGKLLGKMGDGPSKAPPLLRPHDLRLAVMASERLLVLQPHDWALRRDHGMLLFYSGRFGEAVQELSICMAFAPVEEAEVLEPFVEKLHLLRIESTWKSLDQSSSRLTLL